MDEPFVDSPADQELLCIGCGYDLRGLGAEGACPECGVLIARSAIGDRLVSADPRWLSRVCIGQSLVSIGLRLCLWSMLVYLMIVFGTLLVGVSLNIFVRSSPNAALDAIAMIGFGLAGICALGGLAATAVGAIPLTARDPRSTLSEKPTSARNVGRWSLIALVLAVSSAQAATMFWSGASTVTFRVSRLCVLAAIVTIVVSTLVAHVADLLARTSRSDLEQECRRLAKQLRWLIPAMVIAIIPRFVATGARPPWTAATSCAAAILAFALLAAISRLSRIMRDASIEFSQCRLQSKALPIHAP